MPSQLKLRQTITCLGILLAAGKGQRFIASLNANITDHVSIQRNKLLEKLPSGMCIAAASAHNVLQVLPHMVAILPASNIKHSSTDELSNNLMALGCQVRPLPNDIPIYEMAASLTWGMQQVTDEYDSVIIALADMPYVKPSSIAALHEALTLGADIVVPIHQGKRGNPVGFSRRHFPQLLQLTGDQGARALLKMHAVTEVEVDDTGIFRDIDVVDDL